MDSRQFNVNLLARKLSDAEDLLNRRLFGDAMGKISEILVVAEEAYMGDIVTSARNLQKRIIAELEAFKRDSEIFHSLRDAVEKDLQDGRTNDAVHHCQELLQLAPAVRKTDVAKTYQGILDECRAKLPPTAGDGAGEDVGGATGQENTTGGGTNTIIAPPPVDAHVPTQAGQSWQETRVGRVRRLEEIFQDEFVAGHYEACLDVLGHLRDLSEDLGADDRAELFGHLQHLIQEHVADRQRMALLDPALTDAIERQKRAALSWEGRLNFEEARKAYEEALRLANHISDHLSATFCEQKLAQLAVWEEEYARSELTAWGIRPFRILFRSRFDCMEVVREKAEADARKQSLLAQKVNPEDVKVVTVVRARFKGQGPFDASGTCRAIYIRRSWDAGE